jgi:hypothetical protein
MRKLCVAQWFPTVLSLAVCLSSAGADDSSTNALSVSQKRVFDQNLAPMRLHIDSNRVLNSRNEVVQLRGVNIPSLEYTSEGEHVQESIRKATQDWKANIIRLPLAQDRWFGKVKKIKDAGAAYRALVDRLIYDCATAKTYLVLDLHWSDCGQWEIDGGKLAQHSMPDLHSVEFWSDVATRYRNHPNIIFGLYNEPHDVSWEIWRNGGPVTDKPPRWSKDPKPVSYDAVGMQKLYETVRGVGADNVVTVSGLDWGYDLSGLLNGHALEGRNILYETHPYPQKKKWDEKFGSVSKRYAVFVGEWGGGARDQEYFRNLMAYVEQFNLPWTAWSFHPACRPNMLKNWSYEPTVFGEFVKNALVPSAGAANSTDTVAPLTSR